MLDFVNAGSLEPILAMVAWDWCYFRAAGVLQIPAEGGLTDLPRCMYSYVSLTRAHPGSEVFVKIFISISLYAFVRFRFSLETASTLIQGYL